MIPVNYIDNYLIVIISLSLITRSVLYKRK